MEFVSKLEEIMKAEELNLPPSPAFGKYRAIMPPESVAHPAKFNTNLVEHLILKHTRPGDVILDPMAGCYDEETDVLTKAGWKRFSEVTLSDEIATLNPTTWCLEYQKPLGIVKTHYKGKMYRVRTKAIDLLVTPDHNMFVAFRSSLKSKQEWKFSIVPARDIFGKYVIYARDFIWNGIRNEEYITLPSLESNNQFKYPEVKIPIDTFLRFLGYYLAEGFTSISKHAYRVTIATNFKDKYHGKIVKTTEEFAKCLGRKIKLDKRGRIVFSDKRLALYLSRLGDVYTKHIPRDILELPPNKLRVLLEALIEGDGYKKGEGRMEYYTSSSKLADDVQELALKCGYVATKRNLEPKKSVFINGRRLNSRSYFIVSITTRCKRPRVYIKRNLWEANKHHIDTSCAEEWVDYDGMIYCAEVPNHIMLVKRNGKVVWCGNTGVLGVIASLHGRNAIQVEIEDKFFTWMEKARRNVEKQLTLTPKGWIKNIRGDSRNLSKLLQEADICITSPPYTNAAAENLNVSKYRKGGMFAEEKLIDVAITSPPYLKSAEQGSGINRQREGDVKIGCSTAGRMVTHPEAIDNVKQYGDIDAIITSPPYERQHQGGADTPKVKHGCIKEKYPSQNNIANLPLGNIDAVITSPPYSESLSASKDNLNSEELDETIKRLREHGRTDPKAGGPYGRSLGHPYSSNPNNIGNLPHGNIDAVITSPPYLNVDNVKEGSGEFWRRAKEEGRRWGSKPPAGTEEKQTTSEGNIANLPLGNVDAIITSPPYADTKRGEVSLEVAKKIAEKKTTKYSSGDFTTPGRVRGLISLQSGYSESKENIGNLPLGNIDAIITSPPYAHESTASKPTKLEMDGKFRMGHSRETPYTEEDYREWIRREGGNIGKRKLFIRVPCSPEEAQFHDTRPGRKGTVWEWTKEVEATPEIVEKIQKMKRKNKGRSETYLEAMFKVYSEMFKVLKPGGLAIVVVKPFIRHRQIVDLPYHTYILMSRCGFTLEKLYKLRLKNTSFWRILYYRRNPSTPRIAHEWILICRKPSFNPF